MKGVGGLIINYLPYSARYKFSKSDNLDEQHLLFKKINNPHHPPTNYKLHNIDVFLVEEDATNLKI